MSNYIINIARFYEIGVLSALALVLSRRVFYRNIPYWIKVGKIIIVLSCIIAIGEILNHAYIPGLNTLMFTTGVLILEFCTERNPSL